jgi:hypothetical protein
MQDGVEPPKMDALDADCGFSAGVADNPFGSLESADISGNQASKQKVSLRRNITLVTSLIEGLKVRQHFWHTAGKRSDVLHFFHVLLPGMPLAQ